MAGAAPRQLDGVRPHVYELDRLRVVTALSVVAVHILAFTSLANLTPTGLVIQNAFLTTSHFTREVFMFVTALALVYVYFGRPFDWRRFWWRRGIGVLVPYTLWTLIYVWLNAHPQTLGDFVRTSLLDLATGNASYQLYYILLTLQFYLILPVFLWFIGQVRRHPWQVLSVSLAIQVTVLYLDYRYVEVFPLSHWPGPVPQFLAQYQDSFVLIYQFYFILGGLVALHLDQVRAFLARHGRLVVLAMGAALAVLWAHYAVQVQLERLPLWYVTIVLQPAMVFYCVPVIAFLAWAALRSVERVRARGAAGLASQRRWGVLSDASFGVYLVHPLFVTPLLLWMVPAVAPILPAAVNFVLVWALAAAGSVGLTVLLMHIPFLRALVGRPRMLSRARRHRTSPTPQEITTTAA